ncbi:hypothetical protein D3C83_147120 [compost metagenome]
MHVQERLLHQIAGVAAIAEAREERHQPATVTHEDRLESHLVTALAVAGHQRLVAVFLHGA